MARVAIVSDIHGNLTAFEAVVADIQKLSPDLILHGGDLADVGSAPAVIVDRIREFGWQGVLGNTDEMLFHPESLEAFSAGKPALHPLFDLIRTMSTVASEELSDERLAWLSALPVTQHVQEIALLHASPDSVWWAPGSDAEEETLDEVYKTVNAKVVAYGHIHHPFLRKVRGRTFINCGSVGLPYDGDPRASYVLIDGQEAQIRRVEYDLNREIIAVRKRGGPGHEWTVKMLTSARAQMP